MRQHHQPEPAAQPPAEKQWAPKVTDGMSDAQKKEVNDIKSREGNYKALLVKHGILTSDKEKSEQQEWAAAAAKGKDKSKKGEKGKQPIQMQKSTTFLRLTRLTNSRAPLRSTP